MRSKSSHGLLKRSSRIYLRGLNKGKVEELKEFLRMYKNGINYMVVKYWSEKDFSDDLSGKDITDAIRDRFGITARLSQCISKQAKEVVKSQREKSKCKQRMPRVKSHVANLDSRFVKLEVFDGHFDMCLKLSSGLPKKPILFNRTKHLNQLIENRWEIGKSIRLGYDKKGLFIDLVLEKPKPEKRTEGKILGIDRGFNSMLFTSDGQQIGAELKDKIKKGGKRRKTYQHYITTEENRLLKELNLDGVKTIVMEDLRKIKINKRGRFSRNMNRLLSFWHYAKVGTRIQQICDEHGVSIQFKRPSYTSQRCFDCGNIDSRNRNGDRFKCLNCGSEYHSDYVGAKNLEQLGLAGCYSIRSLPSEVMA